MAHLTGRQRTQHTRRPTAPATQTHTATPTNTTAARPSDAGHPHTHGPTRSLTSQASPTSGTEDLPATT